MKSSEKTKPHVPYREQHRAGSAERGARSESQQSVKPSTPREDKAPCPANREMGLCICSILGLRVSRILDHRAVSGSKSDAPTRAKNCGVMIRKGASKSKLKKNTGDGRKENNIWNIGMLEECDKKKTEYRSQ
jgi:hypothetical protein